MVRVEKGSGTPDAMLALPASSGCVKHYMAHPTAQCAACCIQQPSLQLLSYTTAQSEAFCIQQPSLQPSASSVIASLHSRRDYCLPSSLPFSVTNVLST